MKKVLKRRRKLKRKKHNLKKKVTKNMPELKKLMGQSKISNLKS